MKTIKSLGIFVILALLGVGFSACGEDYKSRLPELIIKNMEFPADLSTQEQVFRNEDLSNYACSSDSSWCVPVIDPVNSKITVTVNANPTYDSRQAVVTLTDIKDAKTRTFTVTQKQKNGLVVKETSFDVAMDGDTIDIEVESNIGYEVEIPQEYDWITRITKPASRGLEKSIVSLKIDRNNSGAVRDGSARIFNTTTGMSNTISIHQMFMAIFNVDNKTIEFDEYGGSAEFLVNANISVDVYTTGGSWLSIPDGMNRTWIDDENFMQKITVEPFNKQKKKSREGHVIVYNETYLKSANVTVMQYNPLFIEESLITIEGKNNRYGIEPYNKDNVALKWETSDEKVATVNENGVVMAVNDGECIITVTSADGKHDNVKVIVSIPEDPTTMIRCRWSEYYDRTNPDSISGVNCTFINNSNEIMYMQSAALYNDGVRVFKSPDYDSPGEEIKANGGKLTLSEGRIDVDSGKGYYAQWVFSCDNKYYTLKFDDEGEIYISEGQPKSRGRK